MSAVRLEGAECLELNPKVRGNFFDCDARDLIRANAARNICARCVVQPECLESALHGPAPKRGIIAGLSATEVAVSRAWLLYEQGGRETPPRRPRPSWLPRSDAAETVEQTLIEAEFGVER